MGRVRFAHHPLPARPATLGTSTIASPQVIATFPAKPPRNSPILPPSLEDLSQNPRYRPKSKRHHHRRPRHQHQLDHRHFIRRIPHVIPATPLKPSITETKEFNSIAVALRHHHPFR